ncbi:hypothetical protein ADIS_1118 [Lunatimonas lonarensis]|uniref:Uncharacterized protein n=1 Tax=Lunatimonas lonarensis TaxID=1232681 RepID=R7ZVS7_9BACT|nr:hypothetical protein [Lunatimonas lonarensis]EON78255.1 hypothetical protein ADIS_1118 [Lunatimonas lonarensis]
MKSILIFCFCVLIAPAIAQTQQSALPKNIVELTGSKGSFKGTLLAVMDSSVTILNHSAPYAPPVTIHFSEITHLKIRKRDSVTKGLLIGMAAGGIASYTIIQATYEPQPYIIQIFLPEGEFQTKVFTTILGSLGGGLLGALIGSSTVHVPINGHYPSYAAASEKLKRYTRTH